MGCAASKLDNEDTVKRCRERRRLMHEAVRARHHMAAAHTDYCRSLRLTGSALCAFAAGEHLAVAEETPHIVMQSPTPTQTPTRTHAPPVSTTSHPRSVGSSKSSRIVSLKRQKKNFRNRPKLPHILSDSELSSPARTLKSDIHYSGPYRAESTYSNTPSQASTAWNWENFYPPSPPDSEFFEHNVREEKINSQSQHHLNVEDNIDSDSISISNSGEESDAVRADSEYDFFRPPRAYRNNKKSTEEMEREEVQCSEWEDHDCYSTSSSSPMSDVIPPSKEPSRKSPDIRSSAGSFRREASPPRSHAPSSVKGESYKDLRMVVRHKDLREIVAAIKKNFDDAASSGEQLSDILEIGRAQLDRSFRNLKKTVYHSSGILSNLSSSWTSKPPLAVKYRLDAEPSNLRSLLSTVERLLAWEKKLYEDVKAREGVRIVHEKKLSTLQSQEYKGEEDAKLDKTKSSIKKLNSLIIVHSQAVTATSSAIITLRDSDLVPQLVELCHGIMYMWKAMHQYHDVQNVVVQQVRGLVNQSSSGDSTTELHRLATRDLESAVVAWHSSFCRLMKYQRDFIQSIQFWFKLTLHPLASDGKMEHHDAFAFFDEWKLALDRVPDTVASEAIKSFINVVHVIAVKQTEELKIKRRTEAATKELEKKSSSLRNIERKFYQTYSMVGLGPNGPDNVPVADDRDPLSEKKSELAACQMRVEEELLRHAKAADVTRAMTLNNLQTGLPGVFQALTNFSTCFSETLHVACTRSYSIK